MRKLIYSMTVSLDGYISGPQGEGDWAIPDEELHRFHNDQVRELGGHLLGRRLYEVMSYWETAEERDPAAPQYALEFARIWKDLPKIVYSNTLTRVEGKTRLSSEDPVAEVPRLKEQPGEPLAVGGATLAATLMRHDLIESIASSSARSSLVAASTSSLGWSRVSGLHSSRRTPSAPASSTCATRVDDCIMRCRTSPKRVAAVDINLCR